MPAPPWSKGHDAQGTAAAGAAIGLLLTVNTVSYAALAGAPFGSLHLAGAVMSGLISAVVGGVVGSRFGPVDAQVFAPRASVAVVIAAAASHFAGEHAGTAAQYAQVLQALAACMVLAALIQVAIALLRWGDLIRAIPHAVTTGLGLGIAACLLWSQWDPLVSASGASALQRAAPLVCAFVTVVAVFTAHRLARRREALLIGLGAALLTVAAMSVVAPADILKQGLLPGLQPVTWDAGPLFTPLALLSALPDSALSSRWAGILGFATLIAFVNAMETLTCTVLVEDVAGQRYDANRALMAGALGSLSAVLLGGLPVAAGSITSLTNLQASGPHRQRTTATLAALSCGAIGALCGSWLAVVPLAAVAGLMAFSAAEVAAPHVSWLRMRWCGRTMHPRRVWCDLAIVAGVTLLMLSTDMLVAIAAGLAAATALALNDMNDELVARHYVVTALPRNLLDAVQVVELCQPLFFATVERVVQLIGNSALGHRFTILDLRSAGGPDSSAAHALARCFGTLRQKGHHVLVVTRAEALPLDQALRECPVFVDLDAAVSACREAVAQAEAAAATAAATAGQRPEALRDAQAAQHARDAVAQQLAQAARQLARRIGPIAQVLVRRAWEHAENTKAFHHELASFIEDEDDRRRFLESLASQEESER